MFKYNNMNIDHKTPTGWVQSGWNVRHVRMQLYLTLNVINSSDIYIVALELWNTRQVGNVVQTYSKIFQD